MRIALIHAVQVAMPPVAEAFARHWPEAELVNLLDDALSVDRERASDLTPAMAQRIDALAGYAQSLGAAGILFTCSAFGPAIEATRSRRDLPVLKPNETMFALALAQGSRLGLLATFPPSVVSMEDELREAAAQAGRQYTLRTVCVPEALRSLKAGEARRHDDLLAAAAVEFSDVGTLMLAHFSTSRARPAVERVVTAPVLTSPDSAVAALRKRLLGDSHDG